MLSCLSTMAPGVREPVLAFLSEDVMDQIVESLSTPLSIAIVGAGFLGLLVGWIVGRKRELEPVAESPPSGVDELRWRHEKLVLLERQEAERDARLQEFLESVSRSGAGRDLAVGARLFGLAESFRDLRQRVGTDLSRLALVEERLDAIGQKGGPRPDAVAASREIAASQVGRLEQVRDRLRPLSLEACRIEEEFRVSGAAGDAGDRLRESLESLRGELEDLPSGWHDLTDEADRNIRDLLAAGSEEEFQPIREILLVDGSETASLRRAEGSPPRETLAELIEILGESAGPEDRDAEDRDTEVSEVDPTSPAPVSPPQPPLPTPVPMTPDAGFQPPSATAEPLNGNGTHGKPDLAETTGEDDPAETETPAAMEEESAEDSTLVVFRSNDASLWGTEIYRGANCRARSLGEIPDWAEWISIERTDTGERVFAPARYCSFSNSELVSSIGFNASNELFYGARHLGMFSEGCPNEVETRFTYGGWGFGHRVGETGATRDPLQASGWEGNEIDSDTVFEISLHAELPEFGEKDQLLEASRTAVHPGGGAFG